MKKFALLLGFCALLATPAPAQEGGGPGPQPPPRPVAPLQSQNGRLSLQYGGGLATSGNSLVLGVPTTTVPGGVYAATAPANQFQTGNSAGVPTFRQPSFSDLVGSLQATQMPALTGDCATAPGSTVVTCGKANGAPFAPSATTDATNAANIATGVLPFARIGPNSLDYTRLTQSSANTFSGNPTGATANRQDMTAAQAAALLPTCGGDTGSGGSRGFAPAPPPGSNGAAFGDPTKTLVLGAGCSWIPQLNNAAPAHINAAAAGLIADGSTDQSAKLTSIVSSAPASGAVIDLPCGTINLGSTVTLSQAFITLQAPTWNCTTFQSTFPSGDVLVMSGSWQAVKNITFRQAGSGTPTRSNGATVALTGAFQQTDSLAFFDCYICIRLSPFGGFQVVDNTNMLDITPDSVASGSGCLTVYDPQYGPDHWVRNFNCYGNTNGNRPATFGVQLYNTGAFHMDHADILGFVNDLLINPGNGSCNNGGSPCTVQASYFNNTYFDSTYGDGVNIIPAVNGYVFTTYFDHCWVTNNHALGANGVTLNGSNSSNPAAINDTKWAGGFIVGILYNGSGAGGSGVYLNDPKVKNTTIENTTIAGYQVGANAANGVSEFSFVNNSIGTYSPFGQGNAMNVSIYVGGGSDGYVIMGNRMAGSANGVIDNANGGNSYKAGNVR